MELITKKAAQRVARIVHQVPQVEVQALVLPLARHLGLPLTEEKLAHLTTKELTSLFTEEEQRTLHLNAERLEQISQCLQEEEALPPIESPLEQDQKTLRVAVASQRGEGIDGHFGSCPHFLVYQVGTNVLRLIEIRSTSLADQAEDKNSARIQLIQDCSILYLQSIGGPAAAKVVRAGIHPVKFTQGSSARKELARLQLALHTPPPWLAKILNMPTSFAKEACQEPVE